MVAHRPPCRPVPGSGGGRPPVPAAGGRASRRHALQALLFGIAHGYQGIQAALRIAVFGALFGLLALWRRSLRPGMIAHTWTDLLSGLFGI